VDDAIAAAGPFAAPDRVEVILPDDVVLDADETLLRQALVNLLQNAARYAPGGGPFRVEASRRDGGLEVRVVDHGPGVPEPERLRIFEPYNRARPGARARGSGLGLAISRGFVAAHGGTLAIETTPGGGATFVITLPPTRQEGQRGP
jgi:two-component system sensor histidine kinase KdpD